MKRVLLSLLIGFFLSPLPMVADHYDYDIMKPLPKPPARSPAFYQITFDLDYNTGDLYICPNYDITGLNIIITANSTTYLDETVSLSAGQSYTDCLDFLGEGSYILTLLTTDGIIGQYAITVEAD
jgi:hypothetical protein